MTPWAVASLHLLPSLRHLQLLDVRYPSDQWAAGLHEAAALFASLERIKSLRELAVGETPRFRTALRLSVSPCTVQRSGGR